MLAKIEIQKIRDRERNSDGWAGQNEEKLMRKDSNGRFKTKLGHQMAKCVHLPQESTKGKNDK